MEQGDLKEMAQEARLALEKERGEWMEKVARVDGLLRTLEADRRVLPAPLCFVLRHVKHPVFSPSRKKSAFFFVK